MKNNIDVLKRTQMFAGVADTEIESMLSCLGAREVKYKKGEYVLRQGEKTDSIAIVTEGVLHIQNDDYWGSRSILGQIEVGEMFGEAYAMARDDTLLNDVVAVEDSVVMFFNVKRIITTCPSSCSFHALVTQNLFFAISEKNRKLVQKLSHMAKRSTREKLISYLSEEAKRQSSSNLTIPFNRQQLADFLSVDRSAMSNELCKMRDEGLLSFIKNNFVLFNLNNA